eukprot:g16337.t1
MSKNKHAVAAEHAREEQPLVRANSARSAAAGGQTQTSKKGGCSTGWIVAIVLIVLVVVGLGVGLGLWFGLRGSDPEAGWEQVDPQQPRPGDVIEVQVYNGNKAAGEDHKGWKTPVTIAREPRILDSEEDVREVSQQYQKRGLAFVRPSVLPFGLSADAATVEELQALDAQVSRIAKTPAWDEYVLREIVGKGRLGAARVEAKTPNVATQVWNRIRQKDKYRAWPLAAHVEDEQVCRRHERGGEEGFKLATLVTDARARSAATKTGDLIRAKTLQFLHFDVSLYGLPEFVLPGLKGLAEIKEHPNKELQRIGKAVKDGAFGNASYGSAYPALGYYYSLMALDLSVKPELTTFQKLMQQPDVRDLAQTVCGLRDEEIEEVARRRHWGLNLAQEGGAPVVTAETVLEIGWVIGYMTGLGVVAAPGKVCDPAKPKSCQELPGALAKLTMQKLAGAVQMGDKNNRAPSQKEMDFVEQDLRDNFMRDLHDPTKSPAQKWGCFWSRLRVADSFNLWMNLTPPADGTTGSAKQFLERATPIKNPLAAVDPFSLQASQTATWMVRSLVHPDAGNEMFVRPSMYYGEVLYFNTEVVAHTAMPDENQEALRFGDTRTSVETRIAVLERCYRKPPLKDAANQDWLSKSGSYVQRIRELCYQGESQAFQNQFLPRARRGGA